MFKKIYLAGGFSNKERPDWRSVIANKLKSQATNLGNPILFDPEKKEISNYVRMQPDTYTTWDLEAIKQSDIVFVYIDKNLIPVGALLELGYAKALGKTIITCIEEDNLNIQTNRFAIVREMSNINTNDLTKAIEILTSLINGRGVIRI